MYKHILMPTDGSELSAKAIKQGVALAKTIHEEVTAIIVSETFHTFSFDPVMVTDTGAIPERFRCESRPVRQLHGWNTTIEKILVDLFQVHRTITKMQQGWLGAAREDRRAWLSMCKRLVSSLPSRLRRWRARSE